MFWIETYASFLNFHKIVSDTDTASKPVVRAILVFSVYLLVKKRPSHGTSSHVRMRKQRIQIRQQCITG